MLINTSTDKKKNQVVNILSTKNDRMEGFAAFLHYHCKEKLLGCNSVQNPWFVHYFWGQGSTCFYYFV